MQLLGTLIRSTVLLSVQMESLEITPLLLAKNVKENIIICMNVYCFFVFFIPVPNGFGVATNASAYFVSFQSDLPIDSIILNYTTVMNLPQFGNVLGIFLSITGTTTQIQNVIGFDNGFRTKDYFAIPPHANTTGDLLSFQESIFIRAPVPEGLFLGNTAMFDFDLTVVAVGDLIQTPFDNDTPVFVTVSQPPGESTIAIDLYGIG